MEGARPLQVPKLWSAESTLQGHKFLRSEESIPGAIIKSSISSRQLALPLDLLNFGNRCGHNPAVLREFSLESDHKRRPYLITKAQLALEQFWKSPFFLEDLPFRYNNNDALTLRQIRTEMREAIILTAKALLHYMCLDTLEIRYNQGSEPCKLSFIAKKAGLSLDRVKAAMKWLVKGGYLVLGERRYLKRKDGTYKALAKIKSISFKLLKLCGISYNALKAEQGKKRKRMLKEKIEQQAKYLESEEAILNSSSRQMLEGASHIEAFVKRLGTDIPTLLKLFKKPPD